MTFYGEEKLSKVKLGFTFRIKKLAFDRRSNFSHVSNAGLQGSNSGYNTRNIDFFFFAL